MFRRREFLKHAGVSLAASSQLSLLGSAANAASGNDYCAMVCILLAGGADSFNMLVPYDTDRYQQYAATRADLALSREDLLPLNSVGSEQYAVRLIFSFRSNCSLANVARGAACLNGIYWTPC